MLEILSYPPVLRGFILLLISGSTFPLCGVCILRMNLLPIRFLLMHGVLLGGALGLAFGIPLSTASLVINILLIFILTRSSQILKKEYGQLTMFLMVATIAIASIIISRFNVPAKDTLLLLWGSLYVTDISALILAGAVALLLLLFTTLFFRQLTALFYDRDVALSMNIRVWLVEFFIMLLIALVIAVAMRLMGALLLDALILMPVIIAGLAVSGLKKMMILSCVLGALFSFAGFVISIVLDIPVSAGVSLPAICIFIIMLIIKKRRPLWKN